MNPLIDFCAGAIVGGYHQCAGRSACIFSRNGSDPVRADRNFNHPSLALKVCHARLYLPVCELVYDLPQLGIALADDLVEPYCPHASFLKLREGPTRFNSFVLSRVTYKEHSVTRMESAHELVHLLRRCERRFVQNIKAPVTGVGLIASGEVPLQGHCLDAGFCKLLRGPRRRRESLNAVALCLDRLTHN